MPNVQAPLEVFCSYAHEDEFLLDELKAHLSVLQRQGLIWTWHDRQVAPGTNWAWAIDAHLETASLILLLVSSNFLASDYCYEIEMQRAIKRHEDGHARVIPIIVRPCDWTNTPFAQLRSLPRDGEPVTEWRNRDSAWNNVVAGVRQAIEGLFSTASPLPSSTKKSTIGQKATVSLQSQITIGRGGISRRALTAIVGGVLLGGVGGTAWLVQSLKSLRITSALPPTPTWTNNRPIGQISLADHPALITWNNTLYIAYADPGSNSLTLVSSTDGVNWTQGLNTIGQFSPVAPALVAWNNNLYMAYVATDDISSLQIIFSKDGTNWINNQSVGQESSSAPALAVCNNTLFLAFAAATENTVRIVSSNDGVSWSDNQIHNVATYSPPALVAWNNTLYMAFVADTGGSLQIVSSKDGMDWTQGLNPTGQSSQVAPALIVWSNTLYMAFVPNDGTNRIQVISSNDGVHWSDSQSVGQTSLMAPTLTVWDNTLYMAFVASNGTRTLLLVSLQG